MSKMADDAVDGTEGFFKRLVSVTERSGNLRKDLKKEILELVSSLRHYLAQVQTNLEAKTTANKDLRHVKKKYSGCETMHAAVHDGWRHLWIERGERRKFATSADPFRRR
jgi:hypothetical protein